jgi:MYXO-CTERM domain-containing protein
MTAIDYFYVCTQDVRFALNATEVWCDGPHKADCACSLDAAATPWPAALLAALGLLALRVHRRR